MKSNTAIKEVTIVKIGQYEAAFFCMDIPQFIYLAIYRHLCCFQMLYFGY